MVKLPPLETPSTQEEPQGKPEDGNGAKERPFSASQINAFLECPAEWLLKYVYGYSAKPSQAMQSGLDVEAAVTARLKSGESPTVAHEWGGDETERHFAENAYAALFALTWGIGDPPVWPRGDRKQWSVRHTLGSFPMIGYLDFLTHRRILDLKTTRNDPGQYFKPSHARQAMIYRSAWDGAPLAPEVTFVYALKRQKCPIVVFTTDAHALAHLASEHMDVRAIPDGSLERARSQVMQTMDTIRYLRSISDREEVRRMLPLDVDHWRMHGFGPRVLRDLLEGTLVGYHPDAVDTMNVDSQLTGG